MVWVAAHVRRNLMKFVLWTSLSRVVGKEIACQIKNSSGNVTGWNPETDSVGIHFVPFPELACIFLLAMLEHQWFRNSDTLIRQRKKLEQTDPCDIWLQTNLDYLIQYFFKLIFVSQFFAQYRVFKYSSIVFNIFSHHFQGFSNDQEIQKYSLLYFHICVRCPVFQTFQALQNFQNLKKILNV